jgi:hypothetical protein
MATTPLMLDHLPGFEIPIKHKEAIRQIHKFAKILVEALMDRYSLSKSTIKKVLAYNVLERARITRIGRPKKLSNA